MQEDTATLDACTEAQGFRVEKPLDPKVRAPALDPTGSGAGGSDSPCDHNLAAGSR